MNVHFSMPAGCLPTGMLLFMSNWWADPMTDPGHAEDLHILSGQPCSISRSPRRRQKTPRRSTPAEIDMLLRQFIIVRLWKIDIVLKELTNKHTSMEEWQIPLEPLVEADGITKTTWTTAEIPLTQGIQKAPHFKELRANQIGYIPAGLKKKESWHIQSLCPKYVVQLYVDWLLTHINKKKKIKNINQSQLPYSIDVLRCNSTKKHKSDDRVWLSWLWAP